MEGPIEKREARSGAWTTARRPLPSASNGHGNRFFAPANGWRMHYVDEGTGAPVVLLHGNLTQLSQLGEKNERSSKWPPAPRALDGRAASFFQQGA
jgi:hypothetical protein